MLGVMPVAIWTGASEKTIKNWFAGCYGPTGAHLVGLARHADDVLGAFLALTGRENSMAAMKLEASVDAIADLLAAVQRLGDGSESKT